MHIKKKKLIMHLPCCFKSYFFKSYLWQNEKMMKNLDGILSVRIIWMEFGWKIMNNLDGKKKIQISHRWHRWQNGWKRGLRTAIYGVGIRSTLSLSVAYTNSPNKCNGMLRNSAIISRQIVKSPHFWKSPHLQISTLTSPHLQISIGA